MEIENVIVDTETLTLCRLCTEHKGKYHIGPNMIDQIKDCFDIQIKNCDGLSQIVCSKCQIIVGEYHLAKNNYKQKQEALLERRRQLILRESEETTRNNEDITSTSIIRIRSPPLPLPPPLHPPPASPQVSSPRSTAPNKVPPVAPNVIIDVDQVPSVSSSERATSPASSTQTQPTPKTAPITHVQTQIIPIANSPAQEEPIPDEQYTYKFTCIFCAKGFMNKGQLRRHRLNFHSNLSRVTCALTTPCCIRMEKINLMKGTGGGRSRQPWVQLRPGHVTKYSPSEPYYFSSRAPMTSDVTSMDLSSSDDDNREPLAKIPKMTPIAEERGSNNVPAYSLSDSDSRGSFDKAASSVAAEERAVVSVVHPEKDTSLLQEVAILEEEDAKVQTTPAKLKAKPKPWMALHDREFVNIIQSCWRQSQKKKVLTAPVAKPWLIDTIKDNMAVEVVFVCSKITKVSMIKSVDIEPNKDPLSALPSYSTRKREDAANGHLRLKRVPLTLPRPNAPPASTSYSVVNLNNKADCNPNLIKILDNQFTPPPTVKQTPSMLHPVPGSVDKQLQTAAAPSQVEPSFTTLSTAINHRSMPRLSPPGASLPVPVTQMSDAPVTNTAKFLAPQGPTDIIPISNTEFFSPPEECDSLTPIIISTVSLAPPAESVSRPQIKCRPTSALLADRVPFPNSTPPPLQMAPSLPPSGTGSMFNAPTASDNVPPNISLPLLSSNLFFNNGMLSSMGMSPFEQFTTKLRENNVFIVKQHIPNEQVDELVRFILTIREKGVANNQFNTDHEFLVEVGGYLDNRILVCTQNTMSNLVDVGLWSHDFQQELIKSLKKPTFLETMKRISLLVRPEVMSCVARFIATIRNCEIWNGPMNDSEPVSSFLG